MINARTTLCSALLASGLTCCVPMDQLPPGSLPNQPSAAVPNQSFPDVDAPAAVVTSSHFTVRGYRENEIRPISVTAETIYSKISNDTGLFSPMSTGSYTLVIYKDHEEFAQKTKLPSGTRMATSGNSIYLYPGDGLEPELAYELTALVLTNYLDRQAAASKWLIEGTALNQEVAQLVEGERQAYRATQANQLHVNRVPFSQMTFAVPSPTNKRRTDTWYMQTESVVSYLFTQGSGLAFGGMITSLRSGADIDQALAANYPGKFRSLADLENAWKYTI